MEKIQKEKNKKRKKKNVVVVVIIHHKIIEILKLKVLIQILFFVCGGVFLEMMQNI
jgi:hypothetical protein